MSATSGMTSTGAPSPLWLGYRHWSPLISRPTASHIHTSPTAHTHSPWQQHPHNTMPNTTPMSSSIASVKYSHNQGCSHSHNHSQINSHSPVSNKPHGEQVLHTVTCHACHKVNTNITMMAHDEWRPGHTHQKRASCHIDRPMAMVNINICHPFNTVNLPQVLLCQQLVLSSSRS